MPNKCANCGAGMAELTPEAKEAMRKEHIANFGAEPVTAECDLVCDACYAAVLDYKRATDELHAYALRVLFGGSHN